eukprot:349602-Chlamydomonas_euryale.AAC.4
MQCTARSVTGRAFAACMGPSHLPEAAAVAAAGVVRAAAQAPSTTVYATRLRVPSRAAPSLDLVRVRRWYPGARPRHVATASPPPPQKDTAASAGRRSASATAPIASAGRRCRRAACAALTAMAKKRSTLRHRPLMRMRGFAAPDDGGALIAARCCGDGATQAATAAAVGSLGGSPRSETRLQPTAGCPQSP